MKIKEYLKKVGQKTNTLDYENIKQYISETEYYITFDSIAIFCCTAFVLFWLTLDILPMAMLSCSALSVFTGWYLVDLLQFNKYNNLYIKTIEKTINQEVK